MITYVRNRALFELCRVAIDSSEKAYADLFRHPTKRSVRPANIIRLINEISLDILLHVRHVHESTGRILKTKICFPLSPAAKRVKFYLRWTRTSQQTR
jgi:hypothetical protein